MPFIIEHDAPPLRVDETGTIRVGNTRIILEVVIDAFHAGLTAAQIVEDFDSLSLADVHGTLGYYLRHQDELDAYLARRAHEAAELRKKIEASQRDLPDLRARILAARKSKIAE